MKTAMQQLIEKLSKAPKPTNGDTRLLLSAVKGMAADLLEEEKNQISAAYVQGLHDTVGTSDWKDEIKSFDYYNNNYMKTFICLFIAASLYSCKPVERTLQVQEMVKTMNGFEKIGKPYPHQVLLGDTIKVVF